MLERTKILLVGCGSMGSAMIKGWAQANVGERQFTVVTPHEFSVMDLRSFGHIDWYERPEDLPAEYKPDVVVMAVKPQVMPDVLRSYFSYALQGALMVTVAAGLKLDFYKPFWGEKAKIVRIMPNLPVAYNKGMIFGVASEALDARDLTLVDVLLSSLGKMLWLSDESKFDASSALSGCGPAYLYLLVDVLTKAGVECGLAAESAEQLARQTMIGAGVLLENASDSADVLKKKVASPGGVTQAALDVLERSPNGLPSLMIEAIRAATARSRELSNG